MAKSLLLRFGAMAPTLQVQIEAQGLTADPTKLAGCQADAAAITRLLLRDLLSDRAAYALRQKVVKAVEKLVQQAAT